MDVIYIIYIISINRRQYNIHKMVTISINSNIYYFTSSGGGRPDMVLNNPLDSYILTIGIVSLMYV